MPAQQKSIKPLDVGGIAGGLKYWCALSERRDVHCPTLTVARVVGSRAGIFFKFAVDEFNLFGGNELAMKPAKHELRGLQAFMQLAIERRVSPHTFMRFPLETVVDWRGFRVVASSLLPINESTLVYGTADGGRTVHTEPQVAAWLKKAACLLNLKPHPVLGRDMSEPVTLHTAADVEVHRGLDGRHYLLDTHRTMPCEEPDGRRGGFLYRLLRVRCIASAANSTLGLTLHTGPNSLNLCAATACRSARTRFRCLAAAVRRRKSCWPSTTARCAKRRASC